MNLLQKRGSLGITILRVIVGVIFLVHGWQKLQGGIDGTAGFFASLNIPLPQVAAILVIATEILGGLALILGVFTRWVAIPLTIDMLVALATVHLSNGFSVQNGGYEFVLVLAAACVALAFLGSGELALDSRLPRRLR